MRRANDQIFQLSLTEIAFTLAFILLLLLGYMLAQADAHVNALEQALLESGRLATNRELFEQARADLAKALSQFGAKPDDVIPSLLSQSKLVQERDVLKKRVDDLDKQLSALTEVRNALDAAHGGAGASNVVQKEVTDALALKAKLEKQLAQDDAIAPQPAKQPPASSPNAASAPAASDQAKPGGGGEVPQRAHPDVTVEALSGLALKAQVQKQLHEQLDEQYVPGQEPALARDLVAAKKQMQALGRTTTNVASLMKENADLRGQLLFLKKKLDGRGGRDYPPCWADEQTGKAEFLFTIVIAPDGLHITPAWPDKRQADALALPNIDRLTTSAPLSRAEFTSAMQDLDRLSKVKNCRHYVHIKNRVTDLDEFNLSRYAIENFFYKLEDRAAKPTSGIPDAR